ncbi:MFS transporter [Paenarthrobacter sp. Z7-10]|uniref:MFS transporter n=1 Tax=Paenarthrobacter sp. Z7-10 TaxID=2787635 RepID=UPI0022A8E921|nr:MFS transporter [Paenarthrobacter sp. Z7-10]
MNRDFLIASSSRFLGSVGYGAVVVSILLHIQASAGDSRHGAWAVTFFLLISTLPMVLLAPWAGRLADTHDSKRLATGASVASAAAVAAMAISMRLFSDYLPALFVLTFVLEASLAVASPTWPALLPRIVGEERTPRAMGSMQATLMLAQMAGPAAGGILVGNGGTAFSFWTAGGCYLLLALGALSIRTRRNGAAGRTDAAKPRLLDGLRIVNRDRLLRFVLIGSLFIILSAEAINVLEVFLVRETLGASAAQYGLLSAVMGAGLVSGSLSAGRISTEKLRLKAFLASAAGASILLILMGLAPNLAALYIFSCIAGVNLGVLNATFGALIILRTPEAHRGQVSAIVMGLTRAVSIGALGVGGLLGSLFDPRTGFVFCGAATLLASAVITVLIAARRPEVDVPAAWVGPADDGGAAARAHDGASSAAAESARGNLRREQETVEHQVADVVQQLDSEVPGPVCAVVPVK